MPPKEKEGGSNFPPVDPFDLVSYPRPEPGRKYDAGPPLKETGRDPSLRAPAIWSLNGDSGLSRHLLDLGLGDEQLQNAVLILGLHILRLHILAHIEAAAERTGVTLLADITALLILLVLVQSLGGAA